MPTILAFFLTNKYGQWITLITVIGIAVAVWFHVHDREIANEATQAFNAQQQAIIIKSQQDLLAKTEELKKIQQDIADNLKAQNDQLAKQLEDFKNANEKSTLPGKDDEVSPFLRDAIERLRKSGQ